MNNLRFPVIGLAFLVVGVLQSGFSQVAGSKWSMGLRGGGNMWINSMNQQKIGFGGDLFVRYHLSDRFALGLVGGYEELKAGQDPIYIPEIPNSVLKFRGMPVSLMEWFYLMPSSKFSPYVYIGVGAVFYKRINGQGQYYTEDKTITTIHIPVGFGFEAFTSPSFAISLDAGFRVLDAVSDNWRGNVIGGPSLELRNVPDGYLTAKAGFSFYPGRASDEDEDEDADGLTNGEESAYKTDRKNPDTDGDGLKDGDEVKVYRTDPLNADTDADRLSDGDEVLRYRTDPLKADTDGDSLRDGDEVLQYKSDPTKRDTDSGSVDDGVEVGRGTNPLDASDDVPAVKKEEPPPQEQLDVKKLPEGPIGTVNFAFASSRIRAKASSLLQDVMPRLQETPDAKIEIIGHADSIGPEEFNQRLSEWRANSVKRWLVKQGVPATRIETSGKGETEPVAPNSTREGRAMNRRVEIRIR
jgi:outer membrane protein OmpA-like peptidoglycan-associated protein